MIAAAFDEAEARDPGHLRTWVVLVDGAEHQLDLIRAEAARRSVTMHIVIDLIHVLEYIWKAAWSLRDAGDPAAEDWVAATNPASQHRQSMAAATPGRSRIADVASLHIHALTWMPSATAAIVNSAFSSGGEHACRLRARETHVVSAATARRSSKFA